MLTVGDAVPDVTLDIGEGDALRLSAIRGRRVALYFYPRDDTPGCTQEARDFTALADDFAAAGVRIVGVSKDSLASHAKFTGKFAIPHALASDVDGRVCEAFGVWVEKSMYGRKYMGIDRATFLIDEARRIVRAWRKVKVPGHAQAVLDVARALPPLASVTPADADTGEFGG